MPRSGTATIEKARILGLQPEEQVNRSTAGTRATGTYEKLAATTDRSYDDTTAARGTTHYYWVTALCADGTESAHSADWAILEP
ncbi:hypothetical protein [Streptomyces sasae]|uniref:hypothetical protein n=1 Tax=Streptomyces sasae TaxID=1266772 RepID=UPI002931CAC0|nr:hypothetical protein [Streptomyces sasae]